MNYRRQAEALAERLYTDEYGRYQNDAKGACRAAAEEFERLDFNVKQCAREMPKKVSCRAAFSWAARFRKLDNPDELFEQLYPLIAERAEDLAYRASEDGSDIETHEVACRADAINQILQEHGERTLTFAAGEAWLR